MKGRDPQVQIVLDLLMKGFTITARQMSREYDIDRLGARIWEIRHELNYDVKDTWIKTNGGARIKGYYMVLVPVQTTMQFDARPQQH